MRKNWGMKIEDNGYILVIRDTDRSGNPIVFDSAKELSTYSRRDLAYYELFLRKENQFELANQIKTYLGKIIRFTECEDMLVPDGNYRTNIPLSHLKNRIEKDIEELGLNLNPDFQRAHVWDLPKRVAYVEFLLKGGSSNPIYFNHEGWMNSFHGEYVIVDGKQRLTSILMFLNNEFPVFKEKDTEAIGFYAKEFDSIPSDIVFVVNNLPNRELVLKWYLQMNEGNIAHTTEELNKVREMLKEFEEPTNDCER